MKWIISLLVLGLTSLVNWHCATTNLFDKNAKPQKISSEYSFTEGPATDPEGNVYFTDQPNNKIIKWSTDGTLSVFMENAGRSNGMYFDQDGNLLTCADEKNQLWRIDPRTKEIEVLIDDFNGQRLNGPNDLWVDPKGGIYFTDPFYKRDWWNHDTKEIEKENVYYLSPDQKSLKVAASDFVRPNGIIGTSDGKMLYVADINDKKTYRFTILPDGSLSDRKLFAEMGI